MKCLCRKIVIIVRKRIREFFNSTMETPVNQFVIVEKTAITQEEYDELIKILDEWKKQ